MLRIILVMIVTIATFSCVVSLAALADGNKCSQVFELNCAECHEIQRGCELLGQSKDEWLNLFDFMKDMGADIPGDELELLSECLVQPDESVKKVCGK